MSKTFRAEVTDVSVQLKLPEVIYNIMCLIAFIEQLRNQGTFTHSSVGV